MKLILSALLFSSSLMHAANCTAISLASYQWFVKEANLEAVHQTLNDHPEYLDARTNYGAPGLFCTNSVTLTEYLLMRGARINAPNWWRITRLQDLKEDERMFTRSYPDLTALLLRHKASITPEKAALPETMKEKQS